MTDDELRRVEDMVATWILDDLPVEVGIMPFSEAEKLGAIALFGEKYGDNVRVIRIPDVSAELCRGHT